MDELAESVLEDVTRAMRECANNLTFGIGVEDDNSSKNILSRGGKEHNYALDNFNSFCNCRQLSNCSLDSQVWTTSGGGAILSGPDSLDRHSEGFWSGKYSSCS